MYFDFFSIFFTKCNVWKAAVLKRIFVVSFSLHCSIVWHRNCRSKQMWWVKRNWLKKSKWASNLQRRIWIHFHLSTVLSITRWVAGRGLALMTITGLANTGSMESSHCTKFSHNVNMIFLQILCCCALHYRIDNGHPEHCWYGHSTHGHQSNCYLLQNLVTESIAQTGLSTALLSYKQTLQTCCYIKVMYKLTNEQILIISNIATRWLADNTVGFVTI